MPTLTLVALAVGGYFGVHHAILSSREAARSVLHAGKGPQTACKVLTARHWQHTAHVSRSQTLPVMGPNLCRDTALWSVQAATESLQIDLARSLIPLKQIRETIQTEPNLNFATLLWDR